MEGYGARSLMKNLAECFESSAERIPAKMLKKKQETVHEGDSMRKTTCCNCPTGCGLKVFLKGDDFVDIYGDEEHPINKGSLCPKGLLSGYHLRNPNRIIDPQIRASLNQPFKRVTWDEAIAITAEKLQTAAQKHGKDSIFFYGNETSPFDYLSAGTWFARCFGSPNLPSLFFPPAFGTSGHIKKMFGVAAAHLLMNTPRDWCNSKCILLYGCDPAASDPITFGPIADARDRGTPILVIDSKKTITASKATLALQVKPGSHATALKGILHLLIQKGFVEENFLGQSTLGFEDLKSQLRQFTPDRVAQACWVNKTDLIQTAALLGKVKPVQVITADWNSRRQMTDEDLFLCGALVCLRGSVGIPGGGLNLLNVSPFSSTQWLGADDKDAPPWGDRASSRSLENLLLDPDQKIGALIYHGNPCSRLADGKKTKAALRNIPAIVHLSAYPNETFHHAHISLPLSSWLEYSGLVANNNGRALQWHNKVMAAPGACKPPLDFWTDLAHACNLSEYFPWKDEKAGADCHAAVNFFLKQNPLTRAVSVENLDPEQNPPGGVLWPCIAEKDLVFEESRFIKGDVRGRNILFQRGRNYAYADRCFPTPSGKVTLFYPIEPNRPHNLTTANSPFPMILTTGVPVDLIEAFGYFVSDRNSGAQSLLVQIHPQIGKLIGVKNGDRITIENSRGNFSARLWVADDVDPRVIWCPEGIDPYQPHFNSESPRSLFKAPASDSAAGPFTMVTIYKAGQKKQKTQRKLVEFLKHLQPKAIS